MLGEMVVGEGATDHRPYPLPHALSPNPQNDEKKLAAAQAQEPGLRPTLKGVRGEGREPSSLALPLPIRGPSG